MDASPPLRTRRAQASASARTRTELRQPPADRTRERTASLNQLLLAGVVLLVAVAVIAGGFPGRLPLFFVGVLVIFVVTGATLVVPWNGIPVWWMTLVPLADIVAIMLMRLSSPGSGFGVLWVFPAMWLAGGFAVWGLIAGVVVTTALFWVTLVVDATRQVIFSSLLLPLAIAAVSVTTFLTARRFAAQRALLDKQARLLGRALERTRRQEQEVTEVLDAVDFGVIRIAADGTISVTNEAHGRLQHAYVTEDADADATAYRADGVTVLPPHELPLERAMRGQSFDEQVVWFGDPDGPRRALSVTARRLRDSAGTDAGAVLVSRDVTAEITALRARDELVASVSHELRTPLTSILGYLDLAIDDADVPRRARRNLEIAERNAERLLAIVADILAASAATPAVGELGVHPVAVDVVDVVRGAVEALLPRAAERSVTIDDSGLEPARALADPQRLRQVVDNLVSNAIKYNRHGGSVSLGTTTDGTSTWIVVRDTGIGISEADQALLFQRFSRGRAVRGTGMHGTGLGLSISRDIARAHGGDITVRSTPGSGSTFLVRLPATPAEPATVQGAS